MRIGIESGEIILGAVGEAERIDCSAFGSSINAATRLEDANKRFNSSILIGEHAVLGWLTTRSSISAKPNCATTADRWTRH